MNEVNAVALKLPQFWQNQPRVWFGQAEAQFQVRNITQDDTKYYYALAALDQDTATRVVDLIEHPPANDKYNALKDRLITTFALSERERARALLDMPDLGDDKPSALMDKMLALLGNHHPCFLFRELFLDRLPEDIHKILVHSEVQDPLQLAQAADRLHQTHCTSASAIRSEPPGRVSGRKGQYRGGPNQRNNPDYCYYHDRFGEKAKNCEPPCSHPSAQFALTYSFTHLMTSSISFLLFSGYRSSSAFSLSEENSLKAEFNILEREKERRNM